MVRRVPDDVPWPDVALSLLDTLWALDVHVGIIRRQLTPLLGWNPSTEAVRAMAVRYQDRPPHVRKTPPACRPVNGMAQSRPVALMPKVEPPKPRSYPAPAGGFSMLGGTIR